MIRAYEKKDYNAVVALWHEAFGDTVEDIANCLHYFAPYLTLYTEGNALLGMFMRLPVYADNKKGDYIYAVATAKCARGRGIATKLLEIAKARVINGERDFLVLVPAKPSLFDFYKKRGFTEGTYVSKLCGSCRAEPNNNLAVKHITPKQMHACRKAYFQKLAAWDEEMLSAIDAVYGGCYYALKSENGEGFCLAYPCADKVIVPELCLSGISAEDALSALAVYFGKEKIEATVPDKNGKAFAMFYPAEAAELYFNIAIN